MYDGELSDDKGHSPTTYAPLTLLSLGSWSNFPQPELRIPAAFEKHPLRIPLQIAVATETALDKVLEVFDGIYGGGNEWQEAPLITPRDILTYARETGASAYMYKGARLEVVEQRARHNQQQALVFNTWCGLVYFYRDMGRRARDDAQKYKHRFANPPPYAPLPLSLLPI